MGSFSDAWRNPGQDEEFDPPNGQYTVEIVDASAFEGGDGREWCKVILRILDGEHADRQVTHFGAAGDHNPVGLRIMQEALLTYGLAPEGIEDLDDLGRAMFDLIGTRAEIAVTHKDGYLRIKVARSFTGTSDVPAPTSDFAAAAQAAASGDEDEIPF